MRRATVAHDGPAIATPTCFAAAKAANAPLRAAAGHADLASSRMTPLVAVRRNPRQALYEACLWANIASPSECADVPRSQPDPLRGIAIAAFGTNGTHGLIPRTPALWRPVGVRAYRGEARGTVNACGGSDGGAPEIWVGIRAWGLLPWR
jgi:hypothetical protein